ncbi:MAG: PEP-CTERM system histidine kinase PrsK [Gammaproteobacteria bacterium]|nr:MAG: PEP-CTERM system histidine kinase PrsK [Gammaproteobacteria bacterium]
MLNLDWTAITTGYGVAAIANALLLVLLLVHWKGRRTGGWLVAAVAVEGLWALARALPPDPSWMLRLAGVLEGARYLAWLVFLAALLAPVTAAGRRAFLRDPRLLGLGGLGALLVAYPLLPDAWRLQVPGSAYYAAYLVLAMGCTALLETFYRHLHPERRWAVKYLVFGLGGMFAYDLFLFANAVLFGRVDATLAGARGLVNAVAVPLLAVAVARNPDWSVDLFVSRRLVLHATTFLVVGAYLVVMGVAGYVIRRSGGDWGRVVQVTLVFLALLGAVVLLASGQLRARLRVFVEKHFFNYRFDYRDEWLRFTHTLAACQPEEEAGVCILRALAGLVESGGGMLWSRAREGSGFRPEAVWNHGAPRLDLEVAADDPLPAFLEGQGWVLDRREWETRPEAYAGLPMPDWFREDARCWLIVPLLDRGTLVGFVVLDRPRAPMEVDWEVRDLLKTAAVQAAVFLGQRKALEALAEARQFEGFHRLSTYILHDLKNIVAQQSLITRSAARHRDNPAFVDDALRVMAHSVERMQQLMRLLQTGGADWQRKARLDLVHLVREVAESLRDMRPHPRLEIGLESAVIESSPQRARAALRNLVRNAQQATPDEGEVVVRLRRERGRILVEVEDTGCGMDAEFVRKRLFRPFDTTKGDTGMGIGVYEMREWVRSLGGEVQVDSTPGVGTRFRLLLPPAEEEAAAPTPAAAPEERERHGAHG